MNLPKANYHDNQNFATIPGSKVMRKNIRPAAQGSHSKTVPSKPKDTASPGLPTIKNNRRTSVEPDENYDADTPEELVVQKRRESRKEKTPVNDYREKPAITESTPQITNTNKVSVKRLNPSVSGPALGNERVLG